MPLPSNGDEVTLGSGCAKIVLGAIGILAAVGAIIGAIIGAALHS